jgi:glutathione synthase/RimK-type ligase-like ATP-grasp enzyme
MKGCIILNAYAQPKQSVEQAERLKKEFNFLNTKVDILLNGAFKTAMVNGKIETEIKKYDFAIFLDKDKYALKAIEKSGMPIYNAYEPITVCDDKMLTFLHLAGNGIPMPKTIPAPLCFDSNATVKRELVDQIVSELGLPVIVKECFGSLGKGVYLAKDSNFFFSECTNKTIYTLHTTRIIMLRVINHFFLFVHNYCFKIKSIFAKSSCAIVG